MSNIGAEMNNPVLDSYRHHHQDFLNVGRDFYAKRKQEDPYHIPLHKRPRTLPIHHHHHHVHILPFNPPTLAQFQNFKPNLVAPPPPPPSFNINGYNPRPVSQDSSKKRVNDHQIINSFLQELISLSSQTMLKQQHQTPSPDDREDSIGLGLTFDPAKLKLRHESVIKSLYGDLSRQCTTCGMRFKSQEEHSHHMDWHVRKNRAAKKSKNSKQMVSRKWFLSSSMLLKAVEANGTHAAPAFFSTCNVEEETNPVESLAVFADEDQKECALCMEEFDEYFSTETNDWMYKGAAYLDETKGATRPLYKSLMGRIVHAKCIYTEEELQSFRVRS